jgi:hypothetical protein
MMSVYRGRPEVIGGRSKRRSRPESDFGDWQKKRYARVCDLHGQATFECCVRGRTTLSPFGHINDGVRSEVP